MNLLPILTEYKISSLIFILLVFSVTFLYLLFLSTLGFDFDYYRTLLDDVRSFRTRFPSDAMIFGGDFNIELYNPDGPDERLELNKIVLFY
jgi:hypothetical protein